MPIRRQYRASDVRSHVPKKQSDRAVLCFSVDVGMTTRGNDKLSGIFRERITTTVPFENGVDSQGTGPSAFLRATLRDATSKAEH